MRRAEILSILSAYRGELQRQYGIKYLALFGSLSRDEATEASDVDLLVEFDRPITLFDLVAVQQHLETLLGVAKVDVVIRDCVYPALRDGILSEAVDVA